MKGIQTGTWKHKKGGEYIVLGSGEHSETGEELVIYMDKSFKMWLRPIDMFLDGRFSLLVADDD